MGEYISVEREGGVAVVRMRRDDKHNAFNRAMSTELTEALDALDADDDVVAVMLAGNGRAFSAGADMNEAVAAIEGSGRSDGMGAVVARAVGFRKPLLACVNGFAYGGGALLAVACDVRIASEAAAFRFPGASYGLVVGASQLPRIVGAGIAKEMLFTGRVVGAEEALRVGLVNAVHPADRIEEAALEVARAVAANSPQALVATKQVVDRATESEAARLEAEWNRELRASEEHHRRFRAAAERVARRGE
jgi:enoyl-CoA hydratase/carnithine racemase